MQEERAVRWALRANSERHTAQRLVGYGMVPPPAAGVRSMSFATNRLNMLPDATAPDGSEVRVLCSASRGSVAHFTLPPHAISRAITHQTVEEVCWVRLGQLKTGPGTAL